MFNKRGQTKTSARPRGRGYTRGSRLEGKIGVYAKAPSALIDGSLRRGKTGPKKTKNLARREGPSLGLILGGVLPRDTEAQRMRQGANL